MTIPLLRKTDDTSHLYYCTVVCEVMCILLHILIGTLYCIRMKMKLRWSHCAYGNECWIPCLYEARLNSSWTHLITPSRNFVEVRWRSLFRNTSLGKRCTPYNAPPTPRKRAADRWSLRNFLPWSSFFMVGKAHKSHGARSELYGGCSCGVPPIHFSIQFSPHAISGLFQPWRGSSESINFEVINGLQHVFEKWVERCKECIAFQGGISKKRPSPHLHEVLTLSNKVSPRTLQTALV
jgi:hypothetical protein